MLAAHRLPSMNPRFAVYYFLRANNEVTLHLTQVKAFSLIPIPDFPESLVALQLTFSNRDAKLDTLNTFFFPILSSVGHDSVQFPHFLASRVVL